MVDAVFKSFCYLFNPLKHISLTKDIYANIESLKNSQQQYWIHFEKPSKNLQHQLIKKLELPKLAHLILFADEVRSRFVRVERGYILIIHGIDPKTMLVNEDFPTLRIWITEKGILSVTTGEIEAIKDLQKAVNNMVEPTAMSCFSHLIECMISYLEDSIYQIDERLNTIEANFEYTEEATHRIMSIRQDIIFLRRYLLPQRDALIYLANRLDFIGDNFKSLFKELSDAMLRQVEAIEMLRERAIIIQDNLTNQIGEIANKRMYLLTIIMLIFTPAFFIMGMFSMYLPIPGMNSKLTWWAVVTLIVLLSYSLYKLFKLKKWL